MEQSVGVLRDAPPTIWFRSLGTGGLKEGERNSKTGKKKETAKQQKIGELGHRFVQDCAVEERGRRLHDGYAQALRTN